MSCLRRFLGFFYFLHLEDFIYLHLDVFRYLGDRNAELTCKGGENVTLSISHPLWLAKPVPVIRW